jgi:hypothetical protein
MDGSLSVSCNRGEHERCDGQPPSEAIRKFLPPEMHDARCTCPCHGEQ